MHVLPSALNDFTGGKESESDPVWEVSADAFPMLGGKAALGRVLIPADNKPGAAPVAGSGVQNAVATTTRAPDVRASQKSSIGASQETDICETTTSLALGRKVYGPMR